MQESGEMYLETIRVLSERQELVRAIDVGNYMGFSKPSVSRAMSLLKKDGYIEVASNGHISFTDKGLEVANTMYERHETITKVLIKMGVPSDIAEKDACRMEHVISNETFDAIKGIMSRL